MDDFFSDTKPEKPPAAAEAHQHHDNDDDDDDDDEAAEVAKAEKESYLSYVGAADAKGFLRHSAALTTSILVNPTKFFEEMPTEGGLAEPAIYFATVALVNALLVAIFSLNPLAFFGTLFMSAICVGTGAVVAHFSIQKMGGKGTLEGTVRVFAFSSAPLLIAFVHLGSLAVGALIACLYSLYLSILGMEKVHELPRKTTALLLGVMTAIGLAFRFRFHL